MAVDRLMITPENVPSLPSTISIQRTPKQSRLFVSPSLRLTLLIVATISQRYDNNSDDNGSGEPRRRAHLWMDRGERK